MTNTSLVSLLSTIFVVAFALLTGFVIVLCPKVGVVLTVIILGMLAILIVKHPWTHGIWFPLFGLAVWSYGFNNIPLIRPLPLVDALVALAVLFAIPYWWPLRRVPICRRLLVLLALLMVVVLCRLIVDSPRFGLLALRDVLFAFELWSILPAIALGVMLGDYKLQRILLLFFSLTTAWFILYPWREHLTAISPIVGIQRPVPLFAFTTAGFLSVPAFFWFLHWPRKIGMLGAAIALWVLLLVQSRGAYLAFIMSAIILLLLRPGVIKKWWRIGAIGLVVAAILWMVGSSLTGRLGVPLGLNTVVEQLKTLIGKEGPGEGSFHHRLIAWSMVIKLILKQPWGPIFGVGLGVDLFQGFAVGPDILVRKPHNDFLEIWARLGIVGFLAWFSMLFLLLKEALRGVCWSSRHGWVMALQIALWIESMSQPAMGFAYIPVVWINLTGLWIGAVLHEQRLFFIGTIRQISSK